MILIAIFLPPLYFLLKKHWVGFFTTTFLLLMGLYCCVTIMLAPVLIFLWMIASTWAVIHSRTSVKRQSATPAGPPSTI